MARNSIKFIAQKVYLCILMNEMLTKWNKNEIF
jgi:hypothetical protein